ncbi:MAG: M48 family metallopeptidase [Sphaerotilus natans subsp. sulfidivorans]|jgi:predicted metal-dependent hydrolase|uniref:M48 family metallopeptidase n=1 Tax=Sphaerotilus sulfidivorans TaxID=639200 RepID=UPI002352FF38|nr:SprT family zinc-dependent metalloprotease [Sphaerotilus sulfidivorans]MCK6402211.1 M48 family metallopeptidase [Sphaerotilus sulfidivorans]
MEASGFDGQHRVTYGDEQIAFTLRRQTERVVSRVAIHVEPDGRVQVDAPPSASLADVLAAVRKRSRWISQHVAAAKERMAHVLPREYVSGEAIHYLGKRYRLKVVVEPVSAAEAKLRGAFVVVNVPRRDVDQIRVCIDTWYRERAREVFATRLKVVSEPLRWVRQPPVFRLQFMTRQWGSCSPSGRLTLNPWLVAAPREGIDYVLLHELCHLKYHDHSRSFYVTLTRHFPDWERVKERLDDQAELFLRR